MDYGGPHTKRNQQQRKKIADDTPGGQNCKKEREEVIYNIKSDSGMQTESQNSKGGEIKKRGCEPGMN